MKIKNKWKWVIALFCLCLFALGCTWVSSQSQAQVNKEDNQIVFTKDTTIEYGDEKTTSKDLVEDCEGTIQEYPEIDPYTIGQQTLTYVWELDGEERTSDLTIEVKDSKKPEITFKEEKVIITKGDDAEPSDNIKKVSDPVDGTLSLCKKGETKGCYTISDSVDTDKVDDYSVSVKAIDKNGNETTKKFTFSVIEAKSSTSSSSASKATTTNKTSTSAYSNSNKKQHYVDESAVIGYRYNDPDVTSYIEQAASGSRFLTYQGDRDGAMDLLGEFWFYYLGEFTTTSGDVYVEERDDGTTQLTFTKETYADLQQALPKAQAKWAEYRNEIIQIAYSLDLYTSDRDLAQQIHDYMVNRFSYLVTDKPIWDIMDTNRGQCYHYAKVFQDLCLAVGLPCQYVTGNNHAWNIVMLDGVAYTVDVTNDDTNSTNQFSWKRA